MVRLIFRRDRMKLPLFFGGFVAVFLLMIPMMRDVYGEPESLATMYATLGVNPAARFMVGPMDGPTLGALVMVELLLWFGMALAFINTIFVVRHTRHNEEIGAQELLLSGPMRRGSGLAAALLVTFVVNAFVVTTLGVGMHYMEVSWDVEESWLFAVAIGVFGFVWAAIAGVVVQLVENGRSANGILALLIGVTFVLRGVGDFLATLGDDGLYYPMWMSTLSPFGWMQATRPLTHPDWI
jgi:ABC-2 type transport system permease protein